MGHEVVDGNLHILIVNQVYADLVCCVEVQCIWMVEIVIISFIVVFRSIKK